MLITFYFMLTTLTTVGYGDFSAVNTCEFSLMIVILIFGVTYFAYVLGSFNNAVANFDNLWAGEDNMANLNSWFQNIAKYKSKLPKNL